jgi:hypothetical protein
MGSPVALVMASRQSRRSLSKNLATNSCRIYNPVLAKLQALVTVAEGPVRCSEQNVLVLLEHAGIGCRCVQLSKLDEKELHVAHTMLLWSDGVPHPGRFVRLNRWRSRVPHGLNRPVRYAFSGPVQELVRVVLNLL